MADKARKGGRIFPSNRKEAVYIAFDESMRANVFMGIIDIKKRVDEIMRDGYFRLDYEPPETCETCGQEICDD